MQRLIDLFDRIEKSDWLIVDVNVTVGIYIEYLVVIELVDQIRYQISGFQQKSASDFGFQMFTTGIQTNCKSKILFVLLTQQLNQYQFDIFIPSQTLALAHCFHQEFSNGSIY